MREEEFAKQVTQLVRDILLEQPKPHKAEPYANLLYQIFLDNKLEIPVRNLKEPTRGDSAFQTDLCVFSEKDGTSLPKVVFEFKDKLTSHDVITYSNKAKRHKQIYPYLRYGLICYGLSTVPKRFFIHNEGLDFCLATKELVADLRPPLEKLVNRELEISDQLESIMFGIQDRDFYRTNVEFKL
ncbi:MAG: hypothetical protein ACXV76_11165 [Halobacteriota archaeon]